MSPRLLGQVQQRWRGPMGSTDADARGLLCGLQPLWPPSGVLPDVLGFTRCATASSIQHVLVMRWSGVRLVSAAAGRSHVPPPAPEHAAEDLRREGCRSLATVLATNCCLPMPPMLGLAPAAPTPGHSSGPSRRECSDYGSEVHRAADLGCVRCALAGPVRRWANLFHIVRIA